MWPALYVVWTVSAGNVSKTLGEQHVIEVRLKETKPHDATLLWIKGHTNVKYKCVTAIFEYIFCYVLSAVISYFTVFSFVFFLPLTSLVSLIFEMCGFLFCQNILWVWHACQNQRMHATCCTSLRRRTGFFFFFFPSPCSRSLWGPPKMSASNSN